LAAIVSFLFFLVYKIRYDKIYGVLEVLETFGQADKAVSASRQILQPPTWQRVSDNAFVYSGHCTRLPGSDDICPALTVLAVASLETNDLQKMTCQLWYDSSIQPISVPITVAKVGNAATSTDPKNIVWSPYVLTCESKFAAIMPFGVSLSLRDESSSRSSSKTAATSAFSAYLHIEAPVLAVQPSGNEQPTDIVACLAPQENHVDSTYPALENVLLHYYFGVREFYLYDNGLTNKLMVALGQAVQHFSDLNVAVLPWNLPVVLDKNSIEQIIANDCHLRARGRGYTTNFVVGLNQILVPKSGLSSVKQALEQSQKSGQLLVDVHKFCSEYPEEQAKKYKSSRMITALQLNVYNTDLSSGLKVKVSYRSGGGQHQVSQDEIAVHDYGNCNNYDMDVNGAESVRDRTISRQAVQVEKFLGNFFPLRTAS